VRQSAARDKHGTAARKSDNRSSAERVAEGTVLRIEALAGQKKDAPYSFFWQVRACADRLSPFVGDGPIEACQPSKVRQPDVTGLFSS
jgi:hypothetical protein